MTLEELNELEEDEKKATPAPWTGGSNRPFHANIDKPAPSLSKHDRKRPDYWRYEDVVVALKARNNLKELIRLAKLGLEFEKKES